MGATKLCLFAAALGAVGCGGSSGGGADDSPSAALGAKCEALSAMAAPETPTVKGTVFTIVMENRDRDEIIGNKKAPYINSLASQYAQAANYHDAFVHPSEANYIWMASGQNFGVLDDNDPSAHSLDSQSHLVDQLEEAGITWRSYQESMGAPCGLKSHGRYAAKHNPFVFFSDVNGWDGTKFQPSERCNQHVVDYSELGNDIAANNVPDYAFITPNLDNDMHDGTIAEGDAWLATEVPKLMATDAYQKGGVIFILWDEGSGSPKGDTPPFLAISKFAKSGYSAQASYDHSSYLKTVEALFGIAALPCDSAREEVSVMSDLFNSEMFAQQ
ncbi:MAG TPA: alkaline phosphatase family protein [Kofleriaceae bacterium]|jgi:phospholipase C